MQYSDEVMKHFSSPHNVGEIENADGIGEVGNPKCGDMMKITIKVGKKDGKEYIEDVKFLTLGCAAAIAASSMMTDLSKGKTLDEALEITRDDINDSLGKLPAQKYHCSILSAEGIHKAIEDYKNKSKIQLKN
ncbi:MAG: iron-sulfur cluster assembly scaffold protein [Patescibacteria group bacterium]|jgi:nitrogen fixation NifU-like protein